MSLLAYKKNAAEAIARLRTLYSRQAGDRIFSRMYVKSPTMEQFAAEHVDGYCDCPELNERIEFWERLSAERTNLEDDSIPSAFLTEMDQGIYGAIIGGEIRFQCDSQSGWISSMVPPILKDWSEFDALKLDKSHPWFERYTDQLEFYLKRGKGKFGVSHFILIDAFNFIFELFGATETYLSAEFHPEMVRKAIDFAYDLNVMVTDAFFERDVLIDGGTCSDKGVWMPGRAVSESIDPFHMTSVDYFERWGREPAERILTHYDGGGILHIHGNGRHLIEVASTIKGAKAIGMYDDIGWPLAIDVAMEIRRRAGDMPLTLMADYPKFVEKLNDHTLPGGVLYNIKQVPDLNTANRLAEKIRAYRA